MDIGWFQNPKKVASTNGFCGIWQSLKYFFTWLLDTEEGLCVVGCSELLIGWYVGGLALCLHMAAAPFTIPPDLPNSKVHNKKCETQKTMKPWRLLKIEGSFLKFLLLGPPYTGERRTNICPKHIMGSKLGVYLMNFKGLGLNIFEHMSNVVVPILRASKEWSKMGNTHIYKLP